MVQTQHSASIGDTLPDFTLPLLSGGKLSTSDLRGKRLLLFFWGSW
jgi:peroxiredoxin